MAVPGKAHGDQSKAQCKGLAGTAHSTTPPPLPALARSLVACGCQRVVKADVLRLVPHLALHLLATPPVADLVALGLQGRAGRGNPGRGG